MQSRQEKALAPTQQKQPGEKYLDRADFVIIGNGIAGLTAAVEARKLAPQKRIVVVTDQLYPTINTPALKQFAIGKLDREQLLAYPSGTERRDRIHVVTARVEEIHAKSKYITLQGKGGFGYDKLLIATGSFPAGLPAKTPGRDFDGVMTLHRLEDYLSLRRRLAEVRDAVVIGGGVHAIETVMGLLYYGIQVHWLIRGTTFMARMLDEVSSSMVLEGIRHSGARIYTETEVVGVVGRVGSVAGVITNRQEMIPCQLVLTCTGTQPKLDLAKHCSQELKLQNGIQVDDQLHTNVPDIFAAGDVASLKNPQTNKYEPRAQWYAAVDQGRIAGAMLAGHEEIAQEPFGVLWHATHLGELSMLTVGEPLKEGSQVITLTDSNSKGYRRVSIQDDRLIGYLSLGKAQPDSLAIKRIIDEGHPVRNITRDLLKGDFDARKYMAQVRSKAAQGIVTRQLPPLAEPLVARLPSGPLRISPNGRQEQPMRIPPAARQERPMYMQNDSRQDAGEPMRIPPAARQERPMYMESDRRQDVSGPMPMIPAARQEDSGPMPMVPGTRQGQSKNNNYNPRETGPYQVPRFEEEAIDAFSGKLPTLSRVYEPGELTPGRKQTEPLQSRSAPIFDEDAIDAFSGKLPAIPGVTSTEEFRGIRSNNFLQEAEAAPTLMPVEDTKWNNNQLRSIWSYAEKEPEPAPRQVQRAVETTNKEPRKHTRGLWAYSDQEKR